MRTIYVDSGYKCHVTDTGGLRAVETDAFDGKCDTYVEGYRLIPAGESWVREDGTVFRGEMTAPWRDYGLLLEFQAQFEAMQAESAAEIKKLQNQLDSAYTEENLQSAYEEGVNSV